MLRMKKVLSAFAVSTMLASLVGCSSDDTLSTKGYGKAEDNLSPTSTIIQGVKVKPLGAAQPVVYLKKGSATLEVSVKNAAKDDAFDVAIMPHLEESGTTSSIGVVSGTGNFSKDSKFDVPKSGYYEVTVAGDTLPSNFKGTWNASVEQDIEKNKNYDKTLHIASFKEKIGGEFQSNKNPIDENMNDVGYVRDIRGFRAIDQNSASISSTDDESNYEESKSVNGKWTLKEKSTHELSNLSKLYYDDSDLEEIATVSTDKGLATLCLTLGKYYLVYADADFKNVELTPQKKLLDFYEEVKPSALFFDSKQQMIYAADNTDNGSVLYQYDVNKKAFIKDNSGKPATKKLPFEEIGATARYAKASDGTFYIANSLTNQGFDIELAAFNEDFKLLAKPIKLTSVPNDMYRGDFTLAAYKNRVDIWSYYDSRILNGRDYNEPLNVGLNKYTITLK